MTKEGADPLLSTEENCSDPVEPPNELEVSHAFTRRMTNLLCVVNLTLFNPSCRSFIKLTPHSR